MRSAPIIELKAMKRSAFMAIPFAKQLNDGVGFAYFLEEPKYLASGLLFPDWNSTSVDQENTAEAIEKLVVRPLETRRTGSFNSAPPLYIELTLMKASSRVT